jgi:hypothetical protein
VIRYFGTLLDSDYGTIDYIKVQLKEKLEEIIKNFDIKASVENSFAQNRTYTKASVELLNHPSNWKYIDNVGHKIKDYTHIQRVAKSLEI